MASKGSLAGKYQVGLAEQARVHVGYPVAGIALAVDEDNLDIGVVDQQSYQLSGGVSGASYNTYFNHKSS